MHIEYDKLTYLRTKLCKLLILAEFERLFRTTEVAKNSGEIVPLLALVHVSSYLGLKVSFSSVLFLVVVVNVEVALGQRSARNYNMSLIFHLSDWESFYNKLLVVAAGGIFALHHYPPILCQAVQCIL